MLNMVWSSFLALLLVGEVVYKPGMLHLDPIVRQDLDTWSVYCALPFYLPLFLLDDEGESTLYNRLSLRTESQSFLCISTLWFVFGCEI